MRVKENVTVYICEHCGKKLFKQSAMAKHEPLCNSNPVNIPACSGCGFLVEYQKEYVKETWPGGYYSEEIRQARAFRCSKLNIGLYHVKVLQLGLPDKYPETFANEQQMPSNCEHSDLPF